MNKNDQLFEIIDGFKNLTSKIKEDNDNIKASLKKKELTIDACKKEYRKLFDEHQELKRKFSELESKINERETITEKNNLKSKTIKRKIKTIIKKNV